MPYDTKYIIYVVLKGIAYCPNKQTPRIHANLGKTSAQEAQVPLHYLWHLVSHVLTLMINNFTIKCQLMTLGIQVVLTNILV